VKVPYLYHHPDGRHWRRKPHVQQGHPLPQGPHYVWHIIYQIDPHDKPDLLMKVPDLYHHPDGRHWRRKPHVQQGHPLPQGPHYIWHIIHQIDPHDKLEVLALASRLPGSRSKQKWARSAQFLRVIYKYVLGMFIVQSEVIHKLNHSAACATCFQAH